MSRSVGGWFAALALVAAACQSGGAASVKPTTTAAAAPEMDLPPIPELDAPADFSFDTAGSPAPLVTLGIARPLGAQSDIASAKKLTEYLSSELGGDVTVRLYADAAAIGVALGSGAIDVAWLTPGAYVKARETAQVRPVARLSRDGFTSYRSVIFVKAGSAATTAKDLKGKKMAWVAQGSASGRTYPRAFLKRQAIDFATFFGTNVDLPDHHAVCEAVLKGDADAGASLSDERPKGDKPLVDGCRSAGFDPADFAIVERYGPIPNDLIAVRADLPQVIEGKVRDALLKMANDEAGKAQLREIFHADAFAAAADSDYTFLRGVKRSVEK